MARSRRAVGVALVGLVEIALVATLVALALGQRVAAVSDFVEQVPGGHLVVAASAVALLLVAAIIMTYLVSD